MPLSNRYWRGSRRWRRCAASACTQAPCGVTSARRVAPWPDNSISSTSSPAGAPSPAPAIRPAAHACPEIVEAEFVDLGVGREAIEIGMEHRHAGLVIALHQREGRARNVEAVIALRHGADEGARQRGLAGAEIALQEDDDAGPCEERQRGAEGLERLRSGEVKRRDRASGGEAFVMAGHLATCLLARPIDGEGAEHGGALVDLGMQRHLALMQFDEALDDGEAEAGAAMAARHRADWKRSKTRFWKSGSMPLPLSETQNCTVPPKSRAPMRMVRPRLEKPMALDRRLVEDLLQPLGIGDEARGIGGHLDVEGQVAPCRWPAASRSRHRLQHGGNIDALEPQLHGAGIDGREVDDGVDDGLQFFRGAADVVDIFLLLGAERPGKSHLQAFGKARRRW